MWKCNLHKVSYIFWQCSCYSTWRNFQILVGFFPCAGFHRSHSRQCYFTVSISCGWKASED